MNDNEIECLIDLEYNDNYYILKNSHLDLLNKNIQINGKIKILDNKMYYDNKFIHREDGPAIEYSNGDNSWFKNGLRHREYGPAIEHASGHKEYWYNGLRHREDEPAIEWLNGDKEWFENGLLHREDGPAIIWSNGQKDYYINGSKISEENFYLEKELKESIINNKISKKNKI